MIRKILFILLVISFTSLDALPKLLYCKHLLGMIKLTECSYRVEGQDIKIPTKTSTLYGFNNMPYALCSSALCKVKSKNSKLSTCMCKIFNKSKNEPNWHRISVGPKSYKRSKPTYRNNLLHTVTSNYSMANIIKLDSKTGVRCRFSKPNLWANCFGVRCDVKYQQLNGVIQTIAICRCPLERTQEFFSSGPTTNAACKTNSKHVWSAASVQQDENDQWIIRDMYHRYAFKSQVAREQNKK